MSARGHPGEAGFLFAEEGQPRVGAVAEVAPVLPGAAFGGGRCYTFAVPDGLRDALAPGRRVRVPIGRSGRLVTGFVVSTDHRVWDTTLRPIDSLLDDASYLTPDLLRLGRWIADYYLCSLGRTLQALVPEDVRRGSGMARVRYARARATIDALETNGRRVRAPRRAVLEFLAEHAPADDPSLPVDEIIRATGVSAALFRAMARDEWIDIEVRRELPPPGTNDATITDPGFDLTGEQRDAVETIRGRIAGGGFSATLVFGVSGCGKTEVYIRAIRDVVARGRQAILLVPEIMLTTQLARRLASRFERVAVTHSARSAAERSRMWRRIAAGDVRVVIGTRSAVFAPCPNLGLICVDEEQETSYKNLAAPRFHVRDVALMRAYQGGFPVVLGSATPSLETWLNCRRDDGAYAPVTIRRRVHDQPLPRVAVVDMRKEAWARGSHVVLSRLLRTRLTETLERGEQAVILMNRRGYATRVFCPQCRSNIQCPNCSVSLVVHVTRNQAICHYCRRAIPLPSVCPNVTCRGPLVRMGLGTQRVEEALRACVPDARIRRVDRDTMRHRRRYEEIICALEDRSIDVIVGTQMVAKGLDFPFVSLVGVIHAEGLAASGDFRAQEHLFQLLTQVAGRAGRARRPGQVVIQSSAPDAPAVRFGARHDFEAFATHELAARRAIGFPPYTRLIRVVVGDDREARAAEGARALADALRELIASLDLSSADVLGPTVCPLARIRGRYRFDLLVRAPDPSAMKTIRSSTGFERALRVKAQSVIVDVDPVSLQ